MMIKAVEQELAEIKQKDLWRSMRRVESVAGRVISINGASLVNFSSNNYLSLAEDKRITEVASTALDRYGLGSTGSRLICGTYAPHEELEESIRVFKHAPEGGVILFNSGYMANIGVVATLMGRGDVIFADRLNHASLIDASILSRALIKRYAHRDMNALEALLKKNTTKGKKLIITDTLFSMEGTLAPLGDIISLAHRYGAFVYIDDAHAVGALGDSGRGALQYMGLEDVAREANVIEMGTLGKAFGSFGAFVTGPKAIIELLRQKARTFIYTTALPPALVAASIKAIEISTNEPERRIKLAGNARQLREGLALIKGIETGGDAHIVPIVTGSARRALSLSKDLFKAGYMLQAIRAPSVPVGRAMLRATLMSRHEASDIRGLLKEIERSAGEE